MNAQKENGYTAINHTTFEALALVKLTEYERCIIDVIIRKTWGWGKKVDWIANSQFVQATGINKGNVSRTLKMLKAKNIVISSDNYIGLQKDPEKWKVIWRDNKSYLRRQQKLSQEQPQKKKEKRYLGETSSPKSSPLIGKRKKDMFWKRKSDDYEELVIDADGDGTPEPEKKQPTKKYPNAPAIRKLFQEIQGRNPAIWKANKNQLESCERLSTERGLEKVRAALEWYEEHKDEKYCPQINSPYSLDSKWTELGAYKLKKDGH